MDLRTKKKRLRQLRRMSHKLNQQAYEVDQEILKLDDEVEEEERAITKARWEAMTPEEQEADIDERVKAVNKFLDELEKIRTKEDIDAGNV